MPNLLDIAYAAGVAVSAPVWSLRQASRHKVLGAFRERMGRMAKRPAGADALLIHAVSVGEINATRALVAGIRAQRPDLHFVISVTTQTGFEQGLKLYGNRPEVTVIRYPLDFSSAVRRMLDAMRPAAVVLMELEVWPNFLRECRRREIPVILANGRITQQSYHGYRRLGPVSRWMFGGLSRVCVQDRTYAARFLDLGVPREVLAVTGNLKFDSAQVADHVDGEAELAFSVGLARGREFIWVCGSTGPGEEELVLSQYRRLLAPPDGFRHRLVIVPRHPQRFDEVAELIQRFRFNVVRRSTPGRPGPNNDPVPPVVLGDTMGELRKFYSLADVVFVGRSLVDLGPRQHGSDMIEPAALGKPVIVGPYTGNFADAMSRFRDADSIFEVSNPDALGQTVRVLYGTPGERVAMGNRARAVVITNQGATARHVELILLELSRSRARVA